VHAVDTAEAPDPTLQTNPEVVPVNEAEPVLQLFVVQHDTAVPAVVVPVWLAVHVVPDGTHAYAFVAVPLT
jgi:hypothetical protein